MRNSIATDRITQRRRDVALARDFVEALRPPFARDDLIAQTRNQIYLLRVTSKRVRVMPRIDRRAYPIAAKSLLRLLPSGSDRVHRIPNSNGTLRSTLGTTRETSSEITWGWGEIQTPRGSTGGQLRSNSSSALGRSRSEFSRRVAAAKRASSRVSGAGTAIQRMPADSAEATPFTESSTATQARGSS